MSLLIDAFLCRTDNVAAIVHDEGSGIAAAIDAPDADAVLARAAGRGWRIGLILVTHRHADHVAGNLAIKAATGCTIVGPAAEADQIPGLDRGLGEGDTVALGEAVFEVLEMPGHTAGGIAYWCAGEQIAFVGDTLFSLGCGRVPDGASATAWSSLSRLAALPRPTRIYCGHDNTENNGRFAATIEPGNLDLAARIDEAAKLRSAGRLTLPTTIGAELAANPFLRANRPRLRRAMAMLKDEPEAVFAELRRRKDNFR